METLRHELKPLGVQVALVEPGVIRTPFYAAPQASAIAAYSPWRDRFFEAMRAFEDSAPGPEAVAEVYADLIALPHPPLRTAVTRQARVFPFLRWLLPAASFESGLRRALKLDKAQP